MSEKIILCFDGTSNKPGDSVEDRGLLSIKDAGITNVLKLHLLFGGDLNDGQHIAGQRSFYFSGVGTRGSRLKQIFDTAFAVERWSLREIVDEGLKIVEQHCHDGDEIFLFGFSRGAAIARRFACSLPDNRPVRFMGLFDTVASVGKPNLDADDNPTSEILFENGTIASGVREALHLLSIDETRIVFRPTLMNRDDRVTEVWLPGVHSDVGGGYREDGLSDSALQIMLEAIEARGLGLTAMPAEAVQYDALLDQTGKALIDLDDVLIQPDHLGKLHNHARPEKIGDLTLAPRHVCVNVNDQPSADLPKIHWTAAERIYCDPLYRPAALRNVPHIVILPDGSVDEFSGLADHLKRGVRRLTRLEIGDAREVACNSLRPLNHSGIALFAGEKYLFSVADGQRWTDLDISCGPQGWSRDDVEKGFLKEAAIASAEFFRRAPGSNWFALMGAVGTDDSELFEVLQHVSTPYTVRTSGEFCSFANDVSRFYSNNSGTIRFRIQRTG